MRGFELAFAPARSRRIVCALLAAVTAYACTVHLYGAARLVLLLLLAGTLAWAWRDDPQRIGKMRVDAYGRVWLFAAGRRKPYPATLQAGSLIHRFGCFLKWRTGSGRVFWQFVPPDAMSRSDFHKLRVWARFGQEK
ncbi:protein YgfX [Conchiformibius kuhniae]|uniref:Protein YgfX n=1 Tax=Conchiformibius kuhniae TaxID=211502 RepID=A0A8T9MVD4_9NEIS|nr:protein YgfX [Conchiformibius kuhniae]UOP05074.1 hypothetical protein LVJ77_01895 [Conchiformibius kuhniae]